MASWSKHVVHVYEVLRYVQSRIPALKTIERLDYWASKISRGETRCEALRLGYCPGERATCYTSCPLYLIQRSIDIGIHILCVNCRSKWFCPALDRVKHRGFNTPCNTCTLRALDCTDNRLGDSESVLPCYILYLGMLQIRRLRDICPEDIAITTTAVIDHKIVEEFFKLPEIDKRAEKANKILSKISGYLDRWYNKLTYDVCRKYNLITLLEHVSQIENQFLEIEFCRRRHDEFGLELAPEVKSVDMPSVIGFRETYNRVINLLRMLSKLLTILTEYYIVMGLIARL